MLGAPKIAHFKSRFPGVGKGLRTPLYSAMAPTANYAGVINPIHEIAKPSLSFELGGVIAGYLQRIHHPRITPLY